VASQPATSLGNNASLPSVLVRRDIFRAKSSTEAKRWVSFLSYQNISNKHVSYKVETNRAIVNKETVVDENDVFNLLERDISSEQYLNSSNEFKFYHEIHNLHIALSFK
jgi:hypothetical protein